MLDTGDKVGERKEEMQNKKQGPDLGELRPGQRPLSHRGRVLDLGAEFSSISQAVGGSRGGVELRPVWLQDMQGHLSWGSPCPVPPFSGTASGPCWDLSPFLPWKLTGQLPPLEKAQLPLLQETSLG